MVTFRICTIFNDTLQYAQMVESLRQVGFTETNSVFHSFDNCAENLHEPYATYNMVLRTAHEPYIIFCHQDVRMDMGDGFQQLSDVIGEMERSFPDWMVLGNAGRRSDFAFVACITEPKGTFRCNSLPQPVVSLDENFLVVRQGVPIRFSSSLSGFHFYGSDICLHALRAGGSCYVVNFHLTHLSSGVQGAPFLHARRMFADCWSGKSRFTFYPTPCTEVLLSRYVIVRTMLCRKKIFRLFYRLCRQWISRELERTTSACNVLSP